MKSYKAINVQKIIIDDEFENFISFFQNEFQNKVLSNNSVVSGNETFNSINCVNDLKETVYDFFFEPRFENILDLVKFKNKQKPQGD
uniref:hypothetical protein n=1 Tax=uncultured Tenacibaculum sp. TaxID=174713 RepID=UPI0026175FA3|nr:hypothetical protein [uncultured Tenacibaculum sp.]